uniref:Uncharacterized protein AlNc14C93G5770 n=1 Tax=Albugo laibachii Nc14 TaxID=890382 RepID=F0WGP3_9STRA|nr:conserved hypothetical protein [Albugo laibachii Nc14]|eukprot:CCA20407.1 conserved hypothetical protein [Albugo laibachii Nc14]
MQMWKRERHLDRDLLPIYIDLKFRLQHNGLTFRRKYRFHTSDIKCIFACDAVEAAQHLVWDFTLARTVWTTSLRSPDKYFRSPYEWSTVVYWTALDLTADACKHYGTHNIIRVLNVIRYVVLKSLWTERNTAIFRPHLLQSRTNTISTALSASTRHRTTSIRISRGLELLRRATIVFKDSLDNECNEIIDNQTCVISEYESTESNEILFEQEEFIRIIQHAKNNPATSDTCKKEETQGIMLSGTLNPF